ncbi:MAG: hypothetical protein ACXV2D_08110 [Halobacteriota archaeon]
MEPEETRIWWAIHTDGKTPKEISELWGLLGEDDRRRVWDSITPFTRQVILDSSATDTLKDYEVKQPQIPEHTQPIQQQRGVPHARDIASLMIWGWLFLIMIVIIVLLVAALFV